jgi:hypothetical protein
MTNVLKIAALLACASVCAAQAKTVTMTTVNSVSITAPVESVQPEAGTFRVNVPTPETTRDKDGNPHVTWTPKKTTIVTDARTAFEGLSGVRDIHAGESVSVSGARQVDGSVLAATVSVGDHNTSSHVSVMSVTSQVKSVDAARGAFVLPVIEMVNTVGEKGQVNTTTMHKTVTVVVTPQTKFDGSSGFSDIHVGETVSVNGDKQPDGTLRASRVSRRADPRHQ